MTYRKKGETPKKLRFQILNRDRFTCQYCGRSAPEVELQVDHRVPVAKGGGSDPSNLVTACRECNIGKRDRPLLDEYEDEVSDDLGQVATCDPDFWPELTI